MVENSVPKNPTPRWIRIALVVSLALNLGIAGLLVGTALRGPEARRGAVETPEGVAMLARAMPHNHQRQLRDTFRNQRDRLESDRRELKNLRENFIEALRAEPFDIAAVKNAFVAQRQILDQVTAAGHSLVISQIEKMTPQERKLYIRRLIAGSRPRDSGTLLPRQ